jgi:hypothetical protein
MVGRINIVTKKIEVEEGQRWKDLKKWLLGPEKKNRYNTKRYSIRSFVIVDFLSYVCLIIIF